MPNKAIIDAAYHANPHGCGFASPTQQFKTLDFAKFKKALEKVSDDEPCIIHFRLATHGSIKKSNCHPFKRGDVYFAHNGILDIKPIGDKTDSETAFLHTFYPDIVHYGLDSDELAYDVYNMIGYSKFAFLQGDNLKMFGDFIKDKDGCFYSNMRFKAYLSFSKFLYKSVI